MLLTVAAQLKKASIQKQLFYIHTCLRGMILLPFENISEGLVVKMMIFLKSEKQRIEIQLSLVQLV